MPNLKIKFRKIFRRILPLVFILAALFLVRWLVITRGYESAVGKYITTGGQSYLVIKKGFFRSLDIEEGFFILNEAQLYRTINLPKVEVKYWHNRLIIFQKVHGYGVNFLPIPSIGFFPEDEKYHSMMILEASKTTPGDWDLIDLKMRKKRGGPRIFFYSYFWRCLFGSKSYKEIKAILSTAIRSRESLYFELDPAKAPIRSFFHRMEDPQMLEYFRARFNETPSERTLGLIRNLVSGHPNDSWLRLHEVEQEALHGDVEKAEELWKKWEKENKSCPDSLLLKNAQSVSWIVSMARLHKEYPDLVDYNDESSDINSRDPEREKKWLLRLYDSGQIMYPEYPLVPHILNPLYLNPMSYRGIPYIIGKLIVQSRMNLFLGKHEENLRIMIASYLLGSSIRMHGYSYFSREGTGIQRGSVRGLTLFALNACETKEDLEKLWSVLEKLDEVTKVPIYPNNPYHNIPPFILSHTRASGKDLHDDLADRTMFQVQDTRFQLLRMAVAARYHLITKGDFPKSEKDFAPLLPEGLPEDIFSEEKTLRFKSPSDDEFLVYGNGPDSTDNSSTFAYDPTNGLISPGDIFIQIPREREYPIPREGVRAANAYELLEQFPNGLPPDPWADTWYRPLSILESTETEPVVIFSFGPDRDEETFTPYVGGSSGSSEGGFIPVPTPAPPPNASPDRAFQWVMRRSDKIPPPPGCWTLEPMYDPTNGIFSPGDLFIEIPR